MIIHKINIKATFINAFFFHAAAIELPILTYFTNITFQTNPVTNTKKTDAIGLLLPIKLYNMGHFNWPLASLTTLLSCIFIGAVHTVKVDF